MSMFPGPPSGRCTLNSLRRPRFTILTAAALAALTLPSAPSTAQESRARSPDHLSTCEVDAYDGPARCGTVEVPEDPDGEGGRRIGLNVLLLPAPAPDSLRRPDPVFILDGGPGQAASRSVDWVVEELADVLETRDVVMVDRRGTGESNPLDCPEGDRPTPEAMLTPRPEGWIGACRRSLAERADLTRYTSPFAADDLDRVRRTLGYERINLYGGSYGSREAFEYMRRHPDHLRSAAVFAVTPQHERALVRSPRSAQVAMDRLLDDCAADRACRGAYPEVRRELREVTERLSEAPARFTMELPDGSESDSLDLTRGRWGSLLRSLLISPGGGAQIPYLIHTAHGGDWDRIGGLYVRLARGSGSAISRGLFLSVICAEEMARTPSSEIGPAATGTFWGPSWVQGIAEQCEDWPTGHLPDGWSAPPEGSTPFLLMSGWLDPIAPPAWARELTRWMPNARRVLVREGHHNFELDACGRRTLARFYETADPFNLDVGCIARSERPDFLVP